jgi:hypothetical protein
MRTSITAYALAAALGMLAAAPATAAAELQPVVTERTADVTMRLLVEGGKLLVGRNDYCARVGLLTGTAGCERGHTRC